VQSLELLLARLRASGLLPLDILDDRLEQLDIALDLLCLGVLGTEALLKDAIGLLGSGKSGSDVAGEEVRLGELVQRLAGLDVLGAKQLRRRVVRGDEELERERVLAERLQDDTGVCLGSAE